MSTAGPKQRSRGQDLAVGLLIVMVCLIVFAALCIVLGFVVGIAVDVWRDVQ